MKLKIISVNLNGIRSAGRKGFFSWLMKENADIICLQEVRAPLSELENELFNPAGYHVYYHCAEKKGYSGVGIYSRIKPKNIRRELKFATADQEGRYIAIDLDGLWVSSLYMPSGTSGEERQKIKFDFLSQFEKYLMQLEQECSHIICGDWNIAHKPIDLKNWRANQKNSGFLPEERAWMDKLFNDMGFVDGFRVVNQEADQYTWWSNWGRSWEKNIGWRIDYHVVSPALAASIQSASIYKAERYSDHAPLILEYDI